MQCSLYTVCFSFISVTRKGSFSSQHSADAEKKYDKKNKQSDKSPTTVDVKSMYIGAKLYTKIKDCPLSVQVQTINIYHSMYNLMDDILSYLKHEATVERGVLRIRNPDVTLTLASGKPF